MADTQSYVPKSVHAGQRPGYWTPTLTPGMISQVRNITGAVWSPDGRYLYYALDFDSRSDIMSLDLSDKSVTQVTTDFPAAPMPMIGQRPASFDFSLSPDGSQIVYMSEKDGKAHLVSSSGGISKLLSLGEGSQTGVAFSPDGKQVAFVAAFGEIQAIAVAGTGGNQWPRIISDTDYFAVAPRWFNDGKRLVYFEFDSNAMPNWENRLVLADLETGQTKILLDGLGQDAAFSHTPGNYAPSPDGKFLAYISEESGWGNIYLLDLETGQSRPLINEKAEHQELVWSPDGSKLAYLKNQDCNITVQMVTLEGQQFSLDEGTFVCAGLAWSPDGTRLSYSKQNSYTPPNLWVFDLNKREGSQVTSYKVGGLSEVGLVDSEIVRWKSADGLEIEGVLLKPEKLQKGKHPLLLYIHGGPINQYHRRWDAYAQYWVNRGWVVLQPNFRGSTGYGKDFRKALLGTWGDLDMLDNMGGIDYLDQQGIIDPTRVVSWGISGGGYATKRLLTGWPDRFKAGVALEGLSNLVSFPDQVDRPALYLLQDLLGVRGENLDLYKERSPVTLAHQIKGALLILMGEKDRRVPAVQGEEMVEALKKAGKTDYEYHEYPGEAHGWRRVVTIEDYIRRMDTFLTKWVLER
jgi:dipeptidyl aminopeptidase/acylaminoacyl peptidase